MKLLLLFFAALLGGTTLSAHEIKIKVNASQHIATSSPLFNGTNIENASYGITNCAERSAIVSAVSNGYKVGDFKELHVMVSSGSIGMPCFICRQVISEFTDKDFPIIYGNSWESHIETTIGNLYPEDSLHELAK